MMRASLRVVAALSATFAIAACQSIPDSNRSESTPAGVALFDATASAHGREAFAGISDISVAYDSHWYGIVKRLQPVLVDAAWRGGSQERLLPGEHLIAQSHSGEAGRKYVLRRYAARQRNVIVQYNGTLAEASEIRDAAALVADAYRVFLLGPLAFLDGRQVFEDLGPTRLDDRLTDRLLVRARPGLGVSTEDRYVLYIDREDRLMRRVRFTIEGLESTRGAVVDVDTAGHRELHGVMWPTRFFERIRRPIPLLPAHRWSMLGLDVNRGLTADDFSGGQFSESAAIPAKRLAP